MKGVISRLIPNRGFGFIRGSEDKMTRFMHAKSVMPISDFDKMHEGMLVEFESVEGGPGGNGLRALKVRIVPNARQ